MQARPANLNVSFSFGYGAAIQVSFSEKNRFRIWLMAVKVRVWFSLFELGYSWLEMATISTSLGWVLVNHPEAPLQAKQGIQITVTWRSGHTKRMSWKLLATVTSYFANVQNPLSKRSGTAWIADISDCTSTHGMCHGHMLGIWKERMTADCLWLSLSEGEHLTLWSQLWTGLSCVLCSTTRLVVQKCHNATAILQEQRADSLPFFTSHQLFGSDTWTFIWKSRVSLTSLDTTCQRKPMWTWKPQNWEALDLGKFWVTVNPYKTIHSAWRRRAHKQMSWLHNPSRSYCEQESPSYVARKRLQDFSPVTAFSLLSSAGNAAHCYHPNAVATIAQSSTLLSALVHSCMLLPSTY